MTTLNKIVPPANVPTFETILMTPEMAAELLAHQGHKRPISASYVNRLARDIISGEWCATHQGIAVDSKRQLVDGHHRCSAIVKAKMAAWVVLATYPDGATTPIGTFDQGIKRTAGHVMEMSALVKPGAGARHEALVRALHIGVEQAVGSMLTTSEVIAGSRKFEREIAWAISTKRKLLRAPHLAAFTYVWPLFPNETATALSCVVDAHDLRLNSPMHKLHIELQKFETRSMGYPHYPEAFIHTLRALDAHIFSRQMKQLKGTVKDSASEPRVLTEWKRRRRDAGLAVSVL